MSERVKYRVALPDGSPSEEIGLLEARGVGQPWQLSKEIENEHNPCSWSGDSNSWRVRTSASQLWEAKPYRSSQRTPVDDHVGGIACRGSCYRPPGLSPR